MSKSKRTEREAGVLLFAAWLGGMILILVKLDDVTTAVGICLGVTFGFVGLIFKLREIDDLNRDR